MKKIKKLLVANRSEIAIRVFRTAHEIGITTVAIYAYEDRHSLHRFKADEAYQIGKEGKPIKSYLDIDLIIATAKKADVDAIHPGYGFLSENPKFAKACADNGIIFIGPSLKALNGLGDKTSARTLAEAANVPILGGTNEAIKSGESGLVIAEKIGFPVILKAAHGGGGRGMRVVQQASEFVEAFEQARSESLTAFGSEDIFIENFIESARHIEIQLMGDQHGNLVHLYERDCSVQRRHQKVVEIAPAPNLSESVKQGLYQAALDIGREVEYSNAGTVEFLVDDDTDKFYFIEVNPRIQVEHTVTEEVVGFDIVKTQILVAQGLPLTDPEIGMGDQAKIRPIGFALQCRITTEDPSNNFMPDYGRVSHYRSTGGFGIRMDAGSAFSGAVVNPYYDSMLVKVTARGHKFNNAIQRMLRVLSEFRIRGVKTNISFLENVLHEPIFINGKCTTRFIDKTPRLFNLPESKDRATKLLNYIGETIVNGNSLVANRPVANRRIKVPTPTIKPGTEYPEGTRDKFKQLGAKKFAQWVSQQDRLFITDTTFRDAHQSLLATRLRSQDMLNISKAYAHMAPNLFSLEMWGGATFDTSMRFLNESPWQRLEEMREKIPNILFQMLIRASSAVGYANYPDNVVQNFIQQAAKSGIDVFRVFDALNWTPNMKVAMDAVNEAGAICEACICYTGDILNPERTKYNLEYYVNLAIELEQMGAHFLCIKDMAGLCKPQATSLLVTSIKEVINIPVHFHTHDTSGIAAASILCAADSGLDIADAAMAPLSGGTSQANLNTIVESLRFSSRNCELDGENLDRLADYWRTTRDFYTPFESPVLPATADLYNHEIPGGQYTNLYEQARSLGLVDQWVDICQTYTDVNRLFGDIVKVTPTSKAVGDMALFMVANQLKADDIVEAKRELDYPSSVIDLIGGMMGQPFGGFPEDVQKAILKKQTALTERPGESLEPANFDDAKTKVTEIVGSEATDQQVISWLLYPKVFEDFSVHQTKFYDTSKLPTPVYFYGMQEDEEVAVEIEKGKTLIIKYLTTGNAREDGSRSVFFELNGIPREVSVIDHSLEASSSKRPKAEAGNVTHVGSSMPGMAVKVLVGLGDWVDKGDPLIVLEAMKMETTILAEDEGKVTQLLVAKGESVDTGDLLVVIE